MTEKFIEKAKKVMRGLKRQELEKQISLAIRDLEKTKDLEQYYKEKNEKDPHLKYYDLEPYRVWKALIGQIEEKTKLIEIGKEILKEMEE